MNIKYQGEEFALNFKEFFPPFMDYSWLTETYYKTFEELSGFRYDVIGIYTKGGQMEKYMSVTIPENIEKRLNSADIRIYEKQFKTYESLLTAFEKDVEKVKNTDFSNKSNEELSAVFMSIQSQLEVLNAYSNFYYFISQVIEKNLRKEWSNLAESEINERLSKLARPIKPHATNRLTGYIINNLPKKTKEDLAKELSERFYWFSSFSSIPRTPESFLEDIERTAMHTHENTTSLKFEINPLYSAILEIASFIKDEQSTYVIPWYWFTLTNMWDTIAKRIGLLHGKELWLLIQDEISRLLNNHTIVDNSDYQQRKLIMILVQKEKMILALNGIEAESFAQKLSREKVDHSKVTEIKGNSAFSGIVKGRVRVINNQDEFSKFEEGEILIAPYTAPEYVPLMKKASAIVTDLGGITSHAAIVSRELRKTCIVGTKIATQVFKDGDMVEVDAERGVVTILKNNT